MSKAINIQVQANVKSVAEEIDVRDSVQAIVANLSLENLKLLAQKSKQPGINIKIKTYKHLI